MTDPKIDYIRVFPADELGGNPAAIVLEADGLSLLEMQGIAADYGHESGFVVHPSTPGTDFRFRFFVPNHEMEMCGHATLGALWLLRRAGRWRTDFAKVETLSGVVIGEFQAKTGLIRISQPAGRVVPIAHGGVIDQILETLGLSADELMPVGIVNATTSRTKTLIPLRSVERLNKLTPKLSQIKAVCDALGSTGLYPFAAGSTEKNAFQARQFPRSSGYPEDAATGIAAAALLYGALRYGLVTLSNDVVKIRQGVAMGRASEIFVQFQAPGDASKGCWVSGAVDC
ncbi:PhzF family phenazine biosynthesis protein [Paralcaligenes ureilyticus]|uniref:PhzF family phenazine biosynthesis protein n=1 Tax=Paralcaligenes ureilyticus TaxID=627131 RepID=A0A4R3M0W5_9BURK|nr:PhzF family phenazine biosynthesis isomerase [Paralcaligenes ureilyticus]TCT06363.1 PhzF family phenazine biosynthesis protein [Paralcaligenes ureilyticus]